MFKALSEHTSLFWNAVWIKVVYMEVESWAQNKIRRLSQNHMQLWNRRFKVLVTLESILCNKLTMGTAYSTNCVTSKNGKLSSHIDGNGNSFELTIL